MSSEYPTIPSDPSPELVRVWDALIASGVEYSGEGQDWQCPSHEDERASLGVFDGDDGVVIRCQAGCKTKDIINDLELSFRDLFYNDGNQKSAVRTPARVRRPRKAKRVNPKRKVVSKQSWHYETADNKRARSVFRTNYDDGSKVIRQKVSIKGDDGYTLYRLPELRSAIQARRRIVLVEGEKSVDAFDALSAKGYFAVTAPMGGGQGKWRKQYTEQLRGARSVTIISDNDEAGYSYALAAYESLRKAGIAASVRGSATDNPHDDLVDHLAAGFSLDELVKISPEVLRLCAVPASDAPAPDGKKNLRADAAHPVWPAPTEPWACALKFVDENYKTDSNERALINWRKVFYRWDGKQYTETSQEHVRALLYPILESAVFQGANGRIGWNPNRAKVNEIIAALEAYCFVPDDTMPGEWLYTHERSDLVPFANGNLRLTDRALVDATPKLFNLNSLPYEWNPTPEEPTQWFKFLDSLWGKDESSKRLLQEWIGYLISGDTSFQKMLYLVGPPRSGKGTILQVIEWVVGSENVAAPTLSGLVKDFGMEPLIGKTVASIGDARFNTRGIQEVVERLLTISGGDAVTVNRKGKTMPTLRLGVRFNIVSNVLPSLTESSGALARRLLVLHTKNSFLDREDVDLASKLRPELSGIVRWALDGLDNLRERGAFIEPKSSEQARADIEELSSPIATFLKEKVEFTNDTSRLLKSDIYDEYRDWLESRGTRQPPTYEWVMRDIVSVFPNITSKRPRINGVQVNVFIGMKWRDAKSPKEKAIKVTKS